MADIGAWAEGCRVLDAEPDLGAAIAAQDWELARAACRGVSCLVPAGPWEPDPPGGADDLLGFVMVDGLLCREVALCDRHMLELLGPGDILQLPVDATRPRLGGPVRLTAAVDTFLVALGESFVRAAARWPSLLAAVHQRLEAQRHSLAIQGLIAHLPRAEHRLLLGLWHLADRWGRVTPEGTLLPLALPHDLLGQLTAARRSTVTLAARGLESEGCLRRMNDGAWLLTSEAERKVAALTSTSAGAPVLGETFIFSQRLAAVRNESRALRAEAQQIRARRGKRPRRPPDG